MRARIRPSQIRSADLTVPGDKSLAHRWLMLAAAADGGSELAGLPGALDVRSTARCLAEVGPGARSDLSRWREPPPANPEVSGFTWDAADEEAAISALRVEGEGWE